MATTEPVQAVALSSATGIQSTFDQYTKFALFPVFREFM